MNTEGFSDGHVQQLILPYRDPRRTERGMQADYPGVSLALGDENCEILWKVIFTKVFGSRMTGQIESIMEIYGHDAFSVAYFGEDLGTNGPLGVAIRGDYLDLNFTVNGEAVSITPMTLRTYGAVPEADDLPPEKHPLFTENGIASDFVSLLTSNPGLRKYLQVSETFRREDAYLESGNFDIPDYGLQCLTFHDKSHRYFFELLKQVSLLRLNAKFYPRIGDRWSNSVAREASVFFRGSIESHNWSYVLNTFNIIAEYYCVEAGNGKLLHAFTLSDKQYDHGMP